MGVGTYRFIGQKKVQGSPFNTAGQVFFDILTQTAPAAPTGTAGSLET